MGRAISEIALNTVVVSVAGIAGVGMFLIADWAGRPIGLGGDKGLVLFPLLVVMPLASAVIPWTRRQPMSPVKQALGMLSGIAAAAIAALATGFGMDEFGSGFVLTAPFSIAAGGSAGFRISQLGTRRAHRT